jgi:dihydroorotate dehydrogenase
MYRLLFTFLLRRLDPESAHTRAFALMRAVARIRFVSGPLRWALSPRDPALRLRALGLEFSGPLGVAAGFDKDACGVDALSMLGFAAVEVGTVTAQPQPGNPRPRLFRLLADRAVINRMGFNNDGAAACAARLRRRGVPAEAPRPVVGVNIGRTKIVPESLSVEDYVTSTRAVADVAGYLVVNVSSPNTPGLRDLQAVEHLRPLLAAVRTALDETCPGRRVPLLVKIAPDLADDDIDAVADLALDLGLDGIIATNTTIGREGLRTPPGQVAALGAGGLSGPPLRERSLEVLRRLRARTGGRIVLVAAGGIQTADDAWERITAGATLLQAYTGFIYGGALWPRRVQAGLSRRLRREGMTSLEQAVGSDSKG